MNRSLFFLISTVFAVLAFSVPAQTQTEPPPGTSSISGQVKTGSKPVSGITVAVMKADHFVGMNNTPLLTSSTDSEGKYLLTGLKAGSYRIKVMDIVFVNSAQLPSHDFNRTHNEKPVTLTDGESVKGIDFSISRGGVITGQITLEDGRPLIEKNINLIAKGDHIPVRVSSFQAHLTDDRGIYRLFGIPPGTYTISVGDLSSADSPGFMQGGGRGMILTYYPGVTDESMATPITLQENEEVSGINFKVGQPVKSYQISGVVLAEDSGLPLANITLLAREMIPSGMPGPPRSGCTSGLAGEFTCAGLMPGQYAMNILPSEKASYFAEPVELQIADSDLTGIVIKCRQGKGSLSGIVELEGTVDATLLAQLFRRNVRAFTSSPSKFPTSNLTAPIGPKGEFKLTGLAAGEVFLAVDFQQEDPFQRQRIELRGNPVASLTIGENEEISGVRLVYSYGTGTILGQIRTQEGPLPPGIQCLVMAKGSSSGSERWNISVDSRGQFRIDQLPPGDYEVITYLFENPPPTDASMRKKFKPATQRVTVNLGSESKVEILLDLKLVDQEGAQ
jgi:hypothetical protein